MGLWSLFSGVQAKSWDLEQKTQGGISCLHFHNILKLINQEISLSLRLSASIPSLAHQHLFAFNINCFRSRGKTKQKESLRCLAFWPPFFSAWSQYVHQCLTYILVHMSILRYVVETQFERGVIITILNKVGEEGDLSWGRSVCNSLGDKRACIGQGKAAVAGMLCDPWRPHVMRGEAEVASKPWTPRTLGGPMAYICTLSRDRGGPWRCWSRLPLSRRPPIHRLENGPEKGFLDKDRREQGRTRGCCWNARWKHDSSLLPGLPFLFLTCKANSVCLAYLKRWEGKLTKIAT